MVLEAVTNNHMINSIGKGPLINSVEKQYIITIYVKDLKLLFKLFNFGKGLELVINTDTLYILDCLCYDLAGSGHFSP